MIQHKHIIMRAEIKNPPEKSILNSRILNKEINKLIKAIGMKVVLPARCAYVEAEGNEGYTGQAGLETSHIAYHIWNKPDKSIMTVGGGLLQMDIYTCGCLGLKEYVILLDWIDEQFKLLYCEFKAFDRAERIIEVKLQ